ncbi:MAG: aminotransferase class I/II-fold pyridoxal phosphate-dependent enzyme [Gammaproteobacteria bacterium]
MRNSYSEQLSAIRDAGLWRTHHVRETPQSRFVEYQGKRYLNFNSNDYLGLSADPRLMDAAVSGMQQYGLGSGAANTLSGYTVAHERLCETLATWLGRDKVLLFSSGYQANIAMLTALVKPTDFISADRNNHASLMDGMRMSGAKFKRYTSLPVGAKHLSPSSKRFIVTESIFSMEGNAADLSSLNSIAKEAEATLLVDEAHAFGLYGPKGQGCVAAAGLTQDEVPVIMGTFGKALGLSGAMLAGRADEIDIIMQSARSYLFTTAISPMMAAAATRAVECVIDADEARAHLFSLIRYFREQAKSLHLLMCESESPIQSLLCESIVHTQQFGDALKAKGIWVPVIRYPTVPIELPRLRFTVTALHTKEDIDTLLTAIEEVRHAFQF